MTGDTADIIKFQVLNESLSHKCDTRSGFQIDEFLLIAGLKPVKYSLFWLLTCLGRKVYPGKSKWKTG